MSKKDIEKFVDLLPEKVKDNIDIVSSDELWQDFFLHINPDKTVKVYVPMISRKQANSEDRTTSRITCAPTLFGCLIGYCVAHFDMMDFKPAKKYKAGDYRQGWIINKIPAEFSLKPTNRLVYDSSRSDEHWLVTYDKETIEYPASKIGKMFIKELRWSSRTNSVPQLDMLFYIELTEPIKLSESHSLEKGYWSVLIEDYDNTKSAWNKDKRLKVSQLTAEDYKNTKQYSAAMLSDRPAALNW